MKFSKKDAIITIKTKSQLKKLATEYAIKHKYRSLTHFIEQSMIKNMKGDK